MTNTLPAMSSPPKISELARMFPQKRLAVVRDMGTPFEHEASTTFLYLGQVDRVVVEHFMSNFPKIPELRRLAPGLHAITVELPAEARIEYKLKVTIGDQTVLVHDPFNPRRATDPHGANSVAFGPGYVEPEWVAIRRAPEGKLVRGAVDSAAYELRRAVNWYHPATDTDRPLALLIVHDGTDFVRHAGLIDVLDNLIAERVIPAVVVALVDPMARFVEYADDPRHAAFLAEIVSEAIAAHHVHDDPQRHVYLGASLGAVAALSAAWRNGGTGGLVLLSGSFVSALGGPNQRGPHFLPTIEFVRQFDEDPRRPAAHIYQACGLYEGLAPDNRRFHPLLVSTGATVTYEEHRDGHHWHNWRNRLARGLCLTLGSGDPPPSVTWAHG